MSAVSQQTICPLLQPLASCGSAKFRPIHVDMPSLRRRFLAYKRLVLQFATCQAYSNYLIDIRDSKYFSQDFPDFLACGGLPIYQDGLNNPDNLPDAQRKALVLDLYRGIDQTIQGVQDEEDAARDKIRAFRGFCGLDLRGEIGDALVGWCQLLEDDVRRHRKEKWLGHVKNYFLHEGLTKGRMGLELVEKTIAAIYRNHRGDLRFAQTSRRIALSNKRAQPGSLAQDGVPTGYMLNADLSFSDLSGVDLTNVELSGSDLRWCNLTGVNLESTEFFECDLRGAELGINLLRAWFLRDAMFSEKHLAWLALASEYMQYNVRVENEELHILYSQTNNNTWMSLDSRHNAYAPEACLGFFENYSSPAAKAREVEVISLNADICFRFYWRPDLEFDQLDPTSLLFAKGLLAASSTSSKNKSGEKKNKSKKSCGRS